MTKMYIKLSENTNKLNSITEQIIKIIGDKTQNIVYNKSSWNLRESCPAGFPVQGEATEEGYI